MTATDLAELALLARVALAAPGTVTLHVRELDGPPTAAAVLLHDDDGRPTFVCEPGSPVPPAAARGRAARLTVEHPHERLTVIADGRLARAGAEHVDGTRIELVALHLESVLVEVAVDGDLVQRVVPLELYRSAAPDCPRHWAARVAEHANATYADRLRRCVAHRHGLRAHDVLAATIASLDPSGARVHWIDADGGHVLRLAFGAPARDSVELATLLRDEITRSSR